MKRTALWRRLIETNYGSILWGGGGVGCFCYCSVQGPYGVGL